MKGYGFSLVFILAAAASGCAKDNLDTLHLVSREEISVQKRQAVDSAAETAPADEKPAAEPVEEATKPAAQ